MTVRAWLAWAALGRFRLILPRFGSVWYPLVVSVTPQRFLSSQEWRVRRKAVLDRDGWKCQYPIGSGVCGARASVAGHIIPRAAGGSHDLENLRAECREHSNMNNNPTSWAFDMGQTKPSRRW